MNGVLNTNRVLLVLLAAAVMVTFPGLFLLNFALLILLTKIFLVICLLDFIRKTNWRKETGAILVLVFLAEIVSGVILLFAHKL